MITDFIINLQCPQCGKLLKLTESTVNQRKVMITIVEGVIIVSGCDLKLNCRCGFNWRRDKSQETQARIKLFPFPSLEENSDEK